MLPAAPATTAGRSARWAEGQRLLAQRGGRGKRAAVALFAEGARGGDVACIAALAHAVEVGLAGRPDPDRALRLWKRAAALGEPTATCNVGIYYRQRGAVGLALRWFRKAVALGDTSADLEIAKAMVFGRLTAAELRAVRRRVVRAQSDARLSQQERDDAQAFVACIAADGYQRWARRR
jgi:TPR repeat protein